MPDRLAILDSCILTSAFCLIAAAGFYAGMIHERTTAVSIEQLQLIPDTRPKAATVVLEGVSNGKLTGYVKGDPRLFVGDDIVLPEQDGSFSKPVGSFFINVIDVAVPEGMHFVASKRGTKFYDVDSSGGERIKPDNRVYFATAEEAIAAGYRR